MGLHLYFDSLLAKNTNVQRSSTVTKDSRFLKDPTVTTISQSNICNFKEQDFHFLLKQTNGTLWKGKRKMIENINYISDKGLKFRLF